MITSLQLIHEAKNIRPGNEKQLSRWLSTLIPGDITSFREWLLHDHTEAIHQLIEQLKTTKRVKLCFIAGKRMNRI